MKASIFLRCLAVACLLPLTAKGQTASRDTSGRFFDFTAGLGIAIHSTPSLANYINSLAQTGPAQRIDQFNTAPEFYVVPEFQVSREWSVGLEYSLLVKSYTLGDQYGYSRTDISYEVHLPSLLVHYLVFGDGFRLKFGGGIGYHLIKFDQSFPLTGTSETLRGEGPGFKLDAIGNTKFDDTFYGSIGFDLRWDFLGTLKPDSQPSDAQRSGPALPRMSFFNAGVKFGVTFQILN